VHLCTAPYWLPAPINLIFFPINNTCGDGESQCLRHKGGPVFVELMPLLAGRTLLITVAKADDETIRVNVIPHGKAYELRRCATQSSTVI